MTLLQAEVETSLDLSRSVRLPSKKGQALETENSCLWPRFVLESQIGRLRRDFALPEFQNTVENSLVFAQPEVAALGLQCLAVDTRAVTKVKSRKKVLFP